MRSERCLERVLLGTGLTLLMASCAASSGARRELCEPGECPLEEPGDSESAEMELGKDGVTYVVDNDPKLPLVRYVDGQVGLSNSCGVLIGNKLNRRIPPAYVNGKPLGFC